MTTIVTPIGPLPFNDGLAIYRVAGTLDSIFSGGAFVGFGIDPFGGGHDSFTASITDQAGIQQALSAAAANPNTFLNYMVVGRQIPGTLTALQQNLDFLNTVIGAGTNQLAFILVMPGSDPSPLLTVTASQAALDTNVLAAISNSYFVAATDTGSVSAAPGSDFILAITDTAANINQNLPSIAGANAATRNYGDFARFNLTVTDNAANIGTDLVSIANEFGVDAQFEGLAFQNNNFQGGVQTLSLSLGVTDNKPVPLSIADYEALTNSGPWQGGTILGQYSFTLIDSSAHIATLPALFFVFGNNGNGKESVLPLVSSIAPTGSFVALPVALALALAGGNIPITGPAAANISISDSAANIGETNGLGGLTVPQIDILKAYGVTKISSNDGPIALSVAQALELNADQIGIAAFQNQGVILSDSVADIQALQPTQLTGIVAMGVTQIQSTKDPAVTPFTLNVQQAVALGSAPTPVTVTDANGNFITVADFAANIGVTNGTPALTAPAGIDSLAKLGIQGIVSTDAAPLLLSEAQLAELLAKKIAFSAPNSTISLFDTAAGIANLTAPQIAGLAQDGISQIQATDNPVTLKAPQAVALLGEIIGVSPGLIVSDQAAAIEAIEAPQIGNLAAVYGVTLASSDVPLQLSVAQVQALETGGNTGTVQGPGPSGATVFDTAANIGEVNGNGVEGLTAAQINGLPLLFIANINAFDAALQLTAAQADAIVDAGISVAAQSGAAAVSVDDAAGSIAVMLTSDSVFTTNDAKIDALAQAGISLIDILSGPLNLSLDQALKASVDGLRFTTASGATLGIKDSEQNIQNIDAGQFPNLAVIFGTTASHTAIIQTSDGIPQVVSTAQAVAAGKNNFVFQDAAGIEVEDTEQAIHNLAPPDFTSLVHAVATGTAQPTILLTTDGQVQIISLAQAEAAASDNIVFQDAAGIEVEDTEQAIHNLAPPDFTSLVHAVGTGTAQPTILLTTDGQVQIISVAQAEAAASDNIVFQDDSGVEIDDTTPNFEQLGASDYVTLRSALVNPGAGVTPPEPLVLRTTDGQILKLTLNDAAAAVANGFTFDGPLSIQIQGSLKQLFALTPQQIALISGVGENASVVISDTAGNIGAISTQDISQLAADGIGEVSATDASVTFDVAQADAAGAENLRVSVPNGDTVAVVDTAANDAGLSPTQIGALAALGFTSISSTDGPLVLDLGQGLAAVADNIGLSAPSGSDVAVSDIGAKLGGLSGTELTQLGQDGVTNLASILGPVELSTAQAGAIAGAGIDVTAPSGSDVAVSDIGAKLGGLSGSELTQLGQDGVTNLASILGPVELSTAQAGAIAGAGIDVSAPSGSDVAVSDIGAKLGGLSGTELTQLGQDGVTNLASILGPVELSTAQAGAIAGAGIDVSAPSGSDVAVSDIGAKLGGLSGSELTQLSQDGVTNLASILGPVELSTAQAGAIAGAGIDVTAPSGAEVAVSDIGAKLGALSGSELTQLGQDGVTNLASILGPVELSTAQAGAIAGAGIDVSAPSGSDVAVSDIGAKLGGLSGSELTQLGQDGVTNLASILGPVELSTAQAGAIAGAGIDVSAPSGSDVAVSDIGAKLGGLSGTELTQLGQDGVTNLASILGPVELSTAQAGAIAGAGIDVTAPSGAEVAVSDIGANLGALSGSELTQLGQDGVTNLASTLGSVALSTAQAGAIAGAGIDVSAPSGSDVAVSDIGAKLGGLSGSELTQLGQDGVTNLASILGPVELSTAQAGAIAGAGIDVTAPSGAEVAVSDIGANLGALSGSELTQLGQDGVTNLASTLGSVALSTAQAGAIAGAGIDVSAPSGSDVAVSDIGAKLGGLSGSELTQLGQDGVTNLASILGPVELSTAQAGAIAGAGIDVTAPSGAEVAVSDIGANLGALSGSELTQLGQDGVTNLASILGPVELSTAQAGAIAGAGIDVTAPSGAEVAVSDIGANLGALSGSELTQLGQDGVTNLASTLGSVALSTAQAGAIAGAGIDVSAPLGDTVSIFDVAANIEALTASQIGQLAPLGITTISASDSSLQFNVAQALALEDPIHVAAPAGGSVTLEDAAAAIAALTPAQITGLGALGFTGIEVADASIVIDVAQALSLLTANLHITAPPGDTATVADTAANIASLTAQQIGRLEALGISGASLSGELTAGNGAVTEGHGQTITLTSLIDGLITPGFAGGTETLTKVSATHGTAVLGPTGAVSYTAPASGSDTLSYTVEDEFGDTASGQVAVTVDPGPTAGNGMVTVGHGETSTLTSLIDGLITPGIAGDAETLTKVSATHGTAVLGPTGAVSYTAPASGSDTLSYTVQDEFGDTASGQVAVTVATGSNAPIVYSITTSGPGIVNGNGDLDAGKTVTLTVDFSENVTVNTTGGAPTLKLSDSGTATYTGSSGNSLIFTYTVAAGQNSADLAVNSLALNGAIIKDAAGNKAVLTGAATNPPGTLQIDTAAPTVSSVVANPADADLDAGNTVLLTVTFSETVTVGNLTSTTLPFLTLNDTGTATYTGGSGTTALTFAYTVAPGQNTPDLTVTGLSLNGATIEDLAGNNAILTGAVRNPAGTLKIDTTPPAVTMRLSSDTGISNSDRITSNDALAGSGDPSAVVRFTIDGVAVAATATANGGGNWAFTPTGLADGPHTVIASETDAAGNRGTTSLSFTLDTTPPTVSSVVDSPSNGDLDAGRTVIFSVAFSSAVWVTGTPYLTLNDRGEANYTGGSGTSVLTFTYVVASGQNTPDLAVTGASSTTAFKDIAGNIANLAGLAVALPGSLQIDTTAPKITSITTSGPGVVAGAGDLGAGSMVTFTVDFSETVRVNSAAGLPTLALNDGGTATYAGGSGSTLTFVYTVGGQNTADLALATTNALSLNGATITDNAGNLAVLVGANGYNPAGTLVIDTTAPTITKVVASPASGEVTTGHLLKITLDTSETVNVTGTPVLLLNDGETASYNAAGSTAKKLVFDYTPTTAGITTDLVTSGIELSSTSTITDLAGNDANLSGAGVNLGLRINTTKTGTAGPSGGNYTISGQTELALFGASTANVTFASGDTGTLKFEDSQSFAGTVAGLAFNGSNFLDLSDISFGARTSTSYSGNSAGGMLEVTDGTHTADISLLGNYTASTFVTASDGSGGTLIRDPTAALALLVQSAATFAGSEKTFGASSCMPAPETSEQTLLARPHA